MTTTDALPQSLRDIAVPALLLFAALGGPVSGQQAEPALPRDTIVAVQITLDRSGFSPGTIDGKWGALTQQALAAWQEANDPKPTGQFDSTTGANFPACGPTTTNYVVAAEDIAQLGSGTEDWLERSKLDHMLFTTIVELLAEKFHAKEAFILALNPQITDWLSVKAGQAVNVPNLRAAEVSKPVKAERLKVNLSAKTIRAYDANGKLTALFPCSIAAQQAKRPVGTLTVQTVALNPNYTFDPVNFPELNEQQKVYGKLMIPPGPNNPVGTAWIGLSRPGYGMHGTPHPEQIGRTESHGCFRLANWNAQRLAQMVSIGTPVEVVE